MCGQLLTKEDPGKEMKHVYEPNGPYLFIHCRTCETKYYPGPWHVDSNLDGFWWIKNALTSKRKKIGKVQLKGINYYERAKEECGRRNLALSQISSPGK
jgi:hypothetical protein